MTHAYKSLEPGEQIIISDEPREDLEALARWVSIDPIEAEAEQDARKVLEPEDTPDVPEKKLTAAEKRAAKAELAAAGVAPADVDDAAEGVFDLAGDDE